jgi:tubulin polyglutamylase TTLL11
MNEMARKAALTRAINALYRLYPDDYDFYPRSWLLPEQRQEFIDDHAKMGVDRKNRMPWYIVKPDDGRVHC